MTRYACTNYGCPTRAPVTAASPPTCYTCARPMTAWVPADMTAVFEEIRQVTLGAVDRGVRVMTYPEMERQAAATPGFVPIEINERTVGIQRPPTDAERERRLSEYVCVTIEQVPVEARELAELARLRAYEQSGEPLSPNELIARDRLIYGTGYGRRHKDGRIEHIPAPEMLVERRQSSNLPSGGGNAGSNAIVGSWSTTTGGLTASGGTGGGGGSGNAVAVSSTRASSNAWPAHACGITSRNATGYARNVNGVIIDRGYCEPSGERDLVTAWKCARCHWATHTFTPKSECLVVPVRCDAPALQVRVPGIHSTVVTGTIEV